MHVLRIGPAMGLPCHRTPGSAGRAGNGNKAATTGDTASLRLLPLFLFEVWS